ncbi:MAG: hypothetical protein EA403_09125 [Spirochaetaceae bacterium]|nr:MAG: hypothetical protein EA403_09125 [Spirochaetaceae bacterium]
MGPRALFHAAMKPRHLLVLGGSAGQHNLIRRARADGFFVTVADVNPHAVAVGDANAFFAVSTFDVPGVTEAARRLGCDAVVAVGSDQPVYTAAVASAELGLPFPLSPEVALRVTNKREMKQTLTEAGIPVAPWRILHRDDTSAALGGLAPDFVIKPVDSQGQRGIALLPDAAMVVDHLPRTLEHSRCDYAIVETYYPSNEVTVSGWVRSGRAHIFAVTDRVTMPSATSLGVCPAHRYPSAHAAGHHDEVREITQATVDALGIPEGPIYFQLLIGDQGVRVNEAACRLGGAYEDESIPLVGAVDLIALQLSLCRGDLPALPHEPSSPHPVGTDRAFLVPLLFCRPGTLTGYRGLQRIAGFPGVHTIRILLPIGTVVGTMTNSTQRAGYAVIAGPDIDAVNRALTHLFSELIMEGDEGENLLMDTEALCRHPGAER